jgi:hypothetical protein
MDKQNYSYMTSKCRWFIWSADCLPFFETVTFNWNFAFLFVVWVVTVGKSQFRSNYSPAIISKNAPWYILRHVLVSFKKVVGHFVKIITLNELPLGAGIAPWYITRLRTVWSGVRVPVWAGNFFPHTRVKTCSGAHPASYPMRTRGSFSGGVKLTTQLHLVLRLRTRGAIPPLLQ